MTYWGMEVSSTHSLTSALHGGEWPASRSGSFTPQGKKNINFTAKNMTIKTVSGQP
jgi:hypothetical protein